MGCAGLETRDAVRYFFKFQNIFPTSGMPRERAWFKVETNCLQGRLDGLRCAPGKARDLSRSRSASSFTARETDVVSSSVFYFVKTWYNNTASHLTEPPCEVKSGDKRKPMKGARSEFKAVRGGGV